MDILAIPPASQCWGPREDVPPHCCHSDVWMMPGSTVSLCDKSERNVTQRLGKEKSKLQTPVCGVMVWLQSWRESTEKSHFTLSWGKYWRLYGCTWVQEGFHKKLKILKENHKRKTQECQTIVKPDMSIHQKLLWQIFKLRWEEKFTIHTKDKELECKTCKELLKIHVLKKEHPNRKNKQEYEGGIYKKRGSTKGKEIHKNTFSFFIQKMHTQIRR